MCTLLPGVFRVRCRQASQTVWCPEFQSWHSCKYWTQYCCLRKPCTFTYLRLQWKMLFEKETGRQLICISSRLTSSSFTDIHQLFPNGDCHLQGWETHPHYLHSASVPIFNSTLFLELLQYLQIYRPSYFANLGHTLCVHIHLSTHVYPCVNTCTHPHKIIIIFRLKVILLAMRKLSIRIVVSKMFSKSKVFK